MKSADTWELQEFEPEHIYLPILQKSPEVPDEDIDPLYEPLSPSPIYDDVDPCPLYEDLNQILSQTGTYCCDEALGQM